MKYRHLSRKSSHRRALLRNLVTSLIEHESISTTWPKAKEAQRIAEKMISHGKKNTEASRRQALKFMFVCFQQLMSVGYRRSLHMQRPHEMLPKLFGPLRERYMNRPGGYTRVLRIEPIKEDQAPSAILELVDGPKDMRFALTAKTIANIQARKHEINDMTAANIQKVTRYRPNGEEELERMVESFEKLAADGDHGEEEVKKKRVYPKLPQSR